MYMVLKSMYQDEDLSLAFSAQSSSSLADTVNVVLPNSSTSSVSLPSTNLLSSANPIASFNAIFSY